MITFRHKGDLSKTLGFLERAKGAPKLSILDKYGRMGVESLSAATPVDTGLTASSWYYQVENKNGRVRLAFNNSNIQNGVPIAIILQYGHATGNGGWVEGLDYINPALKPIFEKLTEELWHEVTKK